MKNFRIDELIKHYNLKPHSEGGYFKECHNSENYGNCLFLLANNQIDCLHKLDCDEDSVSLR